jgi:predicted nucleotidyltransferase
MMDYAAALRALVDGGVRFLMVGGAAATAHGSARLTHDLDIVYARNRSNLERLARALAPHAPCLREAGAGEAFQLDTETLAGDVSFALATALGDLDLLGEVAGGRCYEDLLPEAIEIEVFGRRCRCLDLPGLIAVKRAAAAGGGRTEDLEAIAELEALLEERQALDHAAQ